MFFTKINEVSEDLTYSEQLIANYIVTHFKNDDNMDHYTSEQIAQNVGVGQATVVRFSQKLGYPTFKKMILDIKNDVHLYRSNVVHGSESLSDTMGKLHNAYSTSMEEVIKANPPEVIEKVTDMLGNARRVFCYGLHASGALSKTLYYRLLESGEDVVAAETQLEAVSLVLHMDESDVLFLISASGLTPEVVSVAEAANTRHVPIISITGGKDNTIERLSAVALKCAEFDMRTQRFHLVNRCSQMYLLDCIFISLWKRHEEQYIRQLEEVSDYSHKAVVRRHFNYRL